MITDFLKKLFSFAVLLGFGIYIAQLFAVSKLFYYIHERFFGGIQIAYIFSISIAVFFILFSLVHLFSRQRKESFEFKKYLQKTLDVKIIAILLLIILSFIIAPVFILFAILIILVPIEKSKFNLFLKDFSFGNVVILGILILGLVMAPKPLSSGIASQRENSYSTYTSVEKKISLIGNFNTSTANYDIKDWLNSLNYNPDLEYYKNKEVSLSGFIYVPDSKNLSANQFLISRFIVSCCAVDAIPVGLKVEYDFRKDFSENDWLKIHGKFDIQNEAIVIIPDKVEKIDVPNNPYLYL